MFVNIAFVFILNQIVTSALTDYPQPVISCDVGDVAENECNRCVCTFKNIFECTPKECSPKEKDSETNGLEIHSQDSCHPNMVYVQDSTTCICKKDGNWPHKNCNDIFKSLPSNNFTKIACEPNSYAIIDCNVCRCDSKGNIDKDHCTKNECEKEKESPSGRRSSKSSNVYGNCEAKNWYSLAPCQFCFCVNENKLVCNTGNYYAKKLELGAYNLSICGTELIRDAIELIPEHQKSLRYGYKMHTGETETSKQTKTHKFEENHNVAIDGKRGKITINKNNKENNHENEQDKDEYYSETEEVKELIVNKTIARGGVTQLPYERYSGEVDYDSDRKEDGEESEGNQDNEINVEFEQIEETPQSAVKLAQIKDQEKKYASKKLAPVSQESAEHSLTISIPMVLNKVFNMALRKSMLSLNSNTKCEPGTTTVQNCNVCFCLKNTKLLCTNNVCD